MRSFCRRGASIYLIVGIALCTPEAPAIAGILGGNGTPLKKDPVTGTGMASGRGVYGPPSPADVAQDIAQISWQDPPSEVSQALFDAVRRASIEHPVAKAAQAQFKAATLDIATARWQRFPSLSTQMSYGNLNQESKTYSIAPTVTVDMPLWAGGKIDATQNRARAQQWVAYMGLNEALVSIAVNVTQAYFEVIRLTQKESLLRGSVEEHERLVAMMARRVEQEVSPMADLELAQSRLAQIAQEAEFAKAQKLAAQRAFMELTGDEDYDFGTLPNSLPNPEWHQWGEVEGAALAYDPSLRRQSAQADVAKAEADLTRASILPQVSAQYSYNEIYGSRVGVVVKLQAAGGLSQLSAADGAQLRLQGIIDQIAGVRRQVRQQINTDLIENEAALARLRNSTVAASTAGRIKESYVRQFIAGRRSWLDLMNSLRESVNAQLSELDAKASASSSAVRIAIRAGTWRPFNDNGSEQQ